jgi:predicted RNA-binding protein YlqC (UPF0109 family)
MLESVLEQLVRAIVDYPDDVLIKTEHFGNQEKMRISVRDEDVARVIGKEGKTINALRTLLTSLADGRRVNIVISNGTNSNSKPKANTTPASTQE